MTTRAEGKMDGKPFVTTAQWKRKSAKPALSTMPVEIRKQIDSYFIGKWKTTTSWGKKKITGSHESRWNSDKTAVITEGRRNMDGKELTYFEVMGWDSASGEITKNGYGSDGSTSTGAWTNFSNEGWKGYGTGNEGGIPWKSLERLEFSEKGVRYVDEPQDDNPTYVAEHTREG